MISLLGNRMAQFSQRRATDLHGHREQARVLQLEARDDGDHSCGVVLSTALGHCQLFAAVQYFIEIPYRKGKQRGRSAGRPHLLGTVVGSRAAFLFPLKTFLRLFEHRVLCVTCTGGCPLSPGKFIMTHIEQALQWVPPISKATCLLQTQLRQLQMLKSYQASKSCLFNLCLSKLFPTSFWQRMYLRRKQSLSSYGDHHTG